MPGTWLTERPFDEVIHDLAFIVPKIGSQWFTDARWLQRKDVSIGEVTLYDWATLSQGSETVVGIAVVAIDFKGGRASEAQAESDAGTQVESHLYNIPLLITKSGNSIQSEPIVGIIGRDFSGYVYDATGTRAFAAALFGAVKAGKRLYSKRGYFGFNSAGPGLPDSQVRTAVTEDRDTTNTITMVDSSQVIKVYRRLQPGLSPDIEISKGLDGAGFQNFPRPLGYGVYSEGQGVTCPAFFIQEFIENEGDAWDILCEDALRFLKRRVEELSSQGDDRGAASVDSCGKAFDSRESRLGVVTAGLHSASSGVDEERFTPEIMGSKDVAGLINNIFCAIPITMEELRRASRRSDLLEKNFNRHEVWKEKETILACLRQAEEVLASSQGLGMKIRIHGDLHLGQFLQVRRNESYDFVVIDFEGEPLRPVCERLRKSSPLRDVAGMLRSFDYSGYSAAFRMDDSPDEKRHLMEIAREWGRQAGQKFLEGYLEAIHGSHSFLLPKNPRDFQLLLLCFKLEKALYEIRYELRNRPRWVNIAIQGTLDSIDEIRSSLHCGA